MNAPVGRPSAIHIGARSLLSFALEPKAPLSEWLEALDGWLSRSPNFFASKPVILQMGGLDIGLKEYRDLLAGLARRHIRVMAVENSSRLLVGPHLPPVVSGGRVVNADKLFDEDSAAPTAPEAQAAPTPAPAAPAPRPETHYHEGNLRSGQQIVHLAGDVTVIGRVASGAEVVAGGSVHVYGALQGRAFAGVAGVDARIYCREARAELLCIGEAYGTAEDLDSKFEGLPIEASLEGGRIKIRVLN